MESKTVAVLPGSRWQVPLVQKCRNAGYRTLVIDPHKSSPASAYADGCLQSDIFDLEQVVRYCQKEHVDAVLSDQCDIAVPVLAKVGQRLSLSTLTPASAQMFTNKYEMRNFCSTHGLPCPKYKLCRNAEEAKQFFEQMNMPVILKPLDSCSSRGVFTVFQKEDIDRFFPQSLAFSKVEKAVLAEQYIRGTEFTVDGIKTPAKHYSLAISEKKHFVHNTNIACELYFSHKSSRFDYERLARQNDALVEMSPLSWGLTHAEYKFEDGQFYLIEIGARGGGNLISSHIVPYLSGMDTYQYLLDCSLGNISSFPFLSREPFQSRCAVLRFFDVPMNGGVVSRIEGRELLAKKKNIAAYQFNFAPGDCIEDAKTDSDRAGFYIACCETEQELHALMEEIRQNVRIIC